MQVHDIDKLQKDTTSLSSWLRPGAEHREDSLANTGPACGDYNSALQDKLHTVALHCTRAQAHEASEKPRGHRAHRDQLLHCERFSLKLRMHATLLSSRLLPMVLLELP